MKLKDSYSLEETYDQPRQLIKKQTHYFDNKGGLSSQSYGFSSGHVCMWEVDYKENSAKELMLLNCHVAENPWVSLGQKGDPTVHPKGSQSWIFMGRTDAEAETPTLWPHGAKNWLIWKDLDAGKDWGQEEKGTTEDEMVGWHHPFKESEKKNWRASWWKKKRRVKKLS